MPVTDELLKYLNRHFVNRADFLAAANIARSFLHDLIDAHAMPGPIYRVWHDGSMWSSIGGWIGPVREAAADSDWYSPAGIWWARGAKVLAETGANASSIAETFTDAFRADFIAAVASLPVAKFGYAELFADGKACSERSAEMAAQEWSDWINGGYGVCLRHFDARSMVVKTSEAKRIQWITDRGRKQTLTAHEQLDLLDAMERLDAVMLPFAPHERPHGTPGLWIDEPLAKYGLGAIPLIQSTAKPADPSLAKLCA
jgi:hypothetical protein